MYQVGDRIVYGSEGVCTVMAVGEAPLSAMDQSRMYYTLRPEFRVGVIYAPTDVSVRMRPVLTREEAWSLIRGIPALDEERREPMDAKQAAAEYKAQLQDYECADLLRLIRLIYNKNREAIRLGKSYGQTDERFLKRARELLYAELSIALDIPVDRVEDTITRAVEEMTGNE